MSAAPQTKLFGINVGVDPKYILGGLLVVAGLVWFINSRSSGPETGSSSGVADTRNAPATAYPAVTPATKTAHRRERTAALDRGTLRIRPVDATRGDVDPTLRLDLLDRLHAVNAVTPARSLFEVGAEAPSLEAVQKVNTKIMPKPVTPLAPAAPIAPPPPQVDIPLRFYGYVKSGVNGQTNRGLFMEGDNIVVASEGELIDRRYLVVTLTPATARMEDTQMKQGQTLAVVPEANQP